MLLSASKSIETPRSPSQRDDERAEGRSGLEESLGTKIQSEKWSRPRKDIASLLDLVGLKGAWLVRLRESLGLISLQRLEFQC